MKKIYSIVLVVFMLASCSLENDETVAIPDATGEVGIKGFGPAAGQILNATMTRVTSGEEVSSSSIINRSCGGRMSDLSDVGEVRVVSRTSNCDPLSLMTPSFGYMLWNQWDIPAGTTAYFADYYGNGVPGSVSLGDYMTNHFQGLRNEGIPPPIAPGMTRSWVVDSSYDLYYEEPQNPDGSYPNLGDDAALNISTESIEFLRDELVCEVLDVYFDQFYNSPAPDGYGHLIGDVTVEALTALCGGGRVIYVTVEIGHYVYSAPDLPTVDF